MPVDALYVVSLEYPNDIFMSELYKILCRRVLAGLVVKYCHWLILKHLVRAVYENVGYPVLVKRPEILEISGKYSALGRLDYEPADILAEQIIQARRFLFDAVVGIFQDYAVSVL